MNKVIHPHSFQAAELHSAADQAGAAVEDGSAAPAISWRVCLKNEPEITGMIVSEGCTNPNEVVVRWDDSETKWTIGRDRLVFLDSDPNRLKRQLLGSALIGTLERLRDQINDAIADVERVMS